MSEKEVGRSHAARSERGSTAVEFVLLAPILVLILFSIIECGRYFNATITVTQAAREGVRDVAFSKPNATAQATAIAAAQPLVTVTPVVVRTCPSNGSGTSGELRVDSAFSYDIPFFRARTITISRRAVMRCGG